MRNAQKFKPTSSGSALILATILLFVVLSLVASLSYVTVMEQKMSQKTKSSVGAFYNSESGIEWALNKIASSSGTLSNTLTANPDGSVNCPISPDCKVYFLKDNGNAITRAEFSSLTFDDIKVVRSVGTKNIDGTPDTTRAIEAAVAAGSGVCYTCYNGTNSADCCDSQFKSTVVKLGDWGNCYGQDSREGFGFAAFTAPGGNCSGQLPTFSRNGTAYLCCK